MVVDMLGELFSYRSPGLAVHALSDAPAILPAEMGYGHVPAVRAFDDGALAIATSLHSSISLRARTRLRT